MPEKLMTREAFVKQLHGDVDRFSKWWTDAVKRGDVLAEHSMMNEGDWFEQFMMFCDDDGVEVR